MSREKCFAGELGMGEKLERALKAAKQSLSNIQDLRAQNQMGIFTQRLLPTPNAQSKSVSDPDGLAS